MSCTHRHVMVWFQMPLLISCSCCRRSGVSHRLFVIYVSIIRICHAIWDVISYQCCVSPSCSWYLCMDCNKSHMYVLSNILVIKKWVVKYKVRTSVHVTMGKFLLVSTAFHYTQVTKKYTRVSYTQVEISQKLYGFISTLCLVIFPISLKTKERKEKCFLYDYFYSCTECLFR